MLSGCIFVPNFAIQVFLRANPTTRKQPIGILDGIPPQQKLIAVNRDLSNRRERNTFGLEFVPNKNAAEAQ